MVRIWRFHHCGPGSIPGLGTEISHQATAYCSQKNKKQNSPESRRIRHLVRTAEIHTHTHTHTLPGYIKSVYIHFSQKNKFNFIIFFCLLGLHPRHLEVPRLEVELELQLPATATATATARWDLSRVCDLHHSSWHHRILNPLSRARDRTQVLMDPSWVRYCSATKGTPF